MADVGDIGKRKWGRKLWLFGLVAAFAVGFWVFCGFYSIQPIGALPDGSTAIVWRAEGEPFFNSPDALCLKRIGGVSLLCRGLAMSQAPVDRIILRLPYQKWAYRLSTGGREFDR
ncbi:MAG TPA: hypothetical protein VFP12_10890 [Allosphingosinicella sp.]|nr:hypothetical protein [Allosphingosinicella sp.]